MAEMLKITISGMHCTSCALNIDLDLEDTEGVTSASTHYARQYTIVEYDPDKITPKKITSIIEALGYETQIHI